MFKLLYHYYLIKKSGLFDQKYYLLNNPDVLQADVDPLWHYVKIGWKEGRKPSGSYQNIVTLRQNELYEKEKGNPLISFITSRKNDARISKHKQHSKKSSSPTLNFKDNKNLYKHLNFPANFDDLREDEKELLELLNLYNYFDEEWYLSEYPDFDPEILSPILHYIRFGFNTQEPNRYFDSNWYAKFYNDFDELKIRPVTHYLKHGIKVPRKANPIEVISILAVEHCNNNCEFCSTSSPYAHRATHQASEFIPYLDQLVNEKVPFRMISITGGEPFLHPDINEFISTLKNHYPSHFISATTNFYWANERSIEVFAGIINKLDSLLISRYPIQTKRMGGFEKFNSNVEQLKCLCPDTRINVWEANEFWSWELHKEKSEVTQFCGTSDCFILRADGKISHCSVASNLECRPELTSIIEVSPERLFDLNMGTNGFFSWVKKYPFDLCYHCTMWQKNTVKWSQIEK